ncbi:MAG: hypothetical protein ACK4KW_11360 [Gemmobacter sp.]
MSRLGVALALLLGLSACAGERVWAPDETVAAARYVHPGPPELVLVTSLTDRSGEGAHTALLINASERVLFDPAGSWDLPQAPERNDVRFGMTPLMERSYLAFQSAPNYHAVVQRLQVPAEVAEMAFRLALEAGPVAPAMCTQATSALLAKLPGFEVLPQSMMPGTLAAAFARLPGVRTEVLYGEPSELTDQARRRLHQVVNGGNGA